VLHHRWEARCSKGFADGGRGGGFSGWGIAGRTAEKPAGATEKAALVTPVARLIYHVP